MRVRGWASATRAWARLLADLEPRARHPRAGAAADLVAPADVAAPVPAGRAAPAEVRADDLAGRPHAPRRVAVVGAAAVGGVPAERCGAARRSGLGRRGGDGHAADGRQGDGEEGDECAPEFVPAEHDILHGRDVQRTPDCLYTLTQEKFSVNIFGVGAV